MGTCTGLGLALAWPAARLAAIIGDVTYAATRRHEAAATRRSRTSRRSPRLTPPSLCVHNSHQRLALGQQGQLGGDRPYCPRYLVTSPQLCRVS